MTYELLSHTADIGIKVWAGDFKTLFIRAAKGMFAVMARKNNLSQRPLQKKIIVTLQAENLEELLVRWLAELLSLSDCKDIIFTDFDIRRLTIDFCITNEIFNADKRPSLFARDPERTARDKSSATKIGGSAKHFGGNADSRRLPSGNLRKSALHLRPSAFNRCFRNAKINNCHLRANVAGIPRAHFNFKREIKAVTYHNLKIEKQNRRCTAEVIFDV